ncbi:MAG TPA: glycosyl hydrolase 108 family protein [Fibrobacteria bacterium]|nr:glycosyl hydrolase 108 family protein [Fibrobacteria bacterium]
MADFGTAIAKTLAREGGAKYTEVGGDGGGATKFGISQRAYPNEDIRNLTEQRARDLYERDYWDVVQGDAILSQAVAENIFDTAVNMGVRTAGRLAQLCAGSVPVNGVIGNESIAAINGMEERLFLAAYTISKVARYAGICNKDGSQSKFLLGWINRALGAAA